MAGRPGPAVVISKWNTMMGLIDDPAKVPPYPLQPLQGFLNVGQPCIARDDARKVANMLVDADAPVMICGRGSHAANAYDEVAELAGLLGIPVATSYMGKGIVPETHDLAVGSTGAIGQRLANRIVGNADIILAVGTCLAPDNTRNCSFDFINPKYQKIVQIDIEPRNTGWTYPIALGIQSDAKLALRMIIEEIKALNPQVNVKERVQAIKDAKADPDNEFYQSKFFMKEELPLDPERIVKSVNTLLREQDLLLLDAGNNRMFFTKLFQTKRAGQLIGPGGAAGMGWCAGAALGAQLVHKTGKVVGIIGDGGMLMMLHCLVSAKQYKLPVVYVVMNNSSLGNPRDYLTTSGRKSLEYDETDFAAIANAMGVKGYKVKDFVEFEEAFKAALQSDSPTLIDVVVKRASCMRLETLQ
jgi:acetolactate synthase-1/2/3 large subunit